MRNGVLLSVRDLHTWFEMRRWGFFHVGYVRAVDGVSFDLRRGECLAIVGESGCGKSTLIRTILALETPTKGEVVFENRLVSGIEPKHIKWYRSQVGYVQQDPFAALPPFMTIRQILDEPLRINGIPSKREREWRIKQALTEMKLTPVEDFLHKFPHMLSGGQQQRVVLARARILNPKLLIADEPVSMLDASVRVEVLQLLRRTQEELNLAAIYVTHDLSTVRHFSERIFVMYGAQVIEQATTNELLENPSHPYTRSLLDAIAEPDAENARQMRVVPAGDPPSLLRPPPGCRFFERCPNAMKGLCENEAPPDFVLSRFHRVKCWLYQDEKVLPVEETEEKEIS
ncbi:MAG: ABC transporter ATP-binding protein [Firmicutes bacterium]|jgi:peptide/nickel transport system ATP-binding protein|nr:ABC transporter ATP-binding protein [Bacillota bacterium]